MRLEVFFDVCNRLLGSGRVYGWGEDDLYCGTLGLGEIYKTNQPMALNIETDAKNLASSEKCIVMIDSNI